MRRGPLFSFYGAKWRSVPLYPPPRPGATVIEPFAGSACYSLRHRVRRAILVEKDAEIAALWRWLIRATPIEVASLPLLKPGQDVRDLDVHEAAKSLIGFWLSRGASTPRRTMPYSEWSAKRPRCFWGEAARARVASMVQLLDEWEVIEGDYTQAPDIDADWFVDPPYLVAGRHYRHGSEDIDYGALARFCRTRKGRVIVCENTGANWLPFRHLADVKATSRGGARTSAEAVWIRD